MWHVCWFVTAGGRLRLIAVCTYGTVWCASEVKVDRCVWWKMTIICVNTAHLLFQRSDWFQCEALSECSPVTIWWQQVVLCTVVAAWLVLLVSKVQTERLGSDFPGTVNFAIEFLFPQTGLIFFFLFFRPWWEISGWTGDMVEIKTKCTRFQRSKQKGKRASNFVQICSKVVSTREPVKIMNNYFMCVKSFVLRGWQLQIARLESSMQGDTLPCVTSHLVSFSHLAVLHLACFLFLRRGIPIGTSVWMQVCMPALSAL